MQAGSIHSERKRKSQPETVSQLAKTRTRFLKNGHPKNDCRNTGYFQVPVNTSVIQDVKLMTANNGSTIQQQKSWNTEESAEALVGNESVRVSTQPAFSQSAIGISQSHALNICHYQKSIETAYIDNLGKVDAAIVEMLLSRIWRFCNLEESSGI